MRRFGQDKDLGNGVSPCPALGSWKLALEIGLTRFPALQHRKSNPGLTPDRSLRLKPSFMPAQGKRFFASSRPIYNPLAISQESLDCQLSKLFSSTLSLP